MTLAEYLAELLKKNGITKVFAIQGGGSARLIDAIGSAEGIEYICNQHEQASAMSADGYARACGKIGCALSTSGPGATNMLTGACGAFFDSIPMLLITGQVSSFRLKGDLKVRNMHTQETDVVDIFKSVTKYAVMLKDPLDIRYEIEKCLFIATSGRPGPVLIDIPDDYQREEIDPSCLRSFYNGEEYKKIANDSKDKTEYSKIIDLIFKSKKPLLLGGWGIHAANKEDDFQKLAEYLNIPVVLTWAANDLLPEEHCLKVGTLGMNGSKQGNLAVREADLLLIMGARLDQHTIIVSLSDFVPKAKKIVIDIDSEEIRKFEKRGCKIDLAINDDLGDVIPEFMTYLQHSDYTFKCDSWIHRLVDEKNDGQMQLENFHAKDVIVNPYRFIHTLSECMKEEDLIFIDTGSSLVWMEQAFKVKAGQRIHSSLNNTPMGYALPASIGAAIATGKRVYSVNGDGGLQMNLQELATVVRHNLDIKIIVFDNAGYGMVQRTQDTYMGSRYQGTDVFSGLAFPDFEKLFTVYGFDVTVVDNDDCKAMLNDAFSRKGPGCILVKVSLNEDYETFHAEDITVKENLGT